MQALDAGTSALSAMSPRDRIAALVDVQSVEWLDNQRPSPHLARYGLASQADDGIVLARGRVETLPVFIAAQDERFLGGSVGAAHGEALRRLFELACTERPSAVILLAASGGVRLHEANAGELALGRSLRAQLDMRALGIPCLAYAVGDVFGGMSVLACAADFLALSPRIRIGLSGPRVIEALRGTAELDARDKAAVGALFGAPARSAYEGIRGIDESPPSVRAWIAGVPRVTTSFGTRVREQHERLARRLRNDTRRLPQARPALRLFADAEPIDRDAFLWRAPGAWLVAPLGAHTLGPAEAHAMDASLLAHLADDADLGTPLIIVEDSTGHAASRAAEAQFVSQFLAQHAAVIAVLRQRRRAVIGLLAGTGHSAAFFANTLQCDVLFALPNARVETMAPSAIERVTGLATADLVNDDPLLGQPVRHFAALGGVRGIVDDPTVAELLTLARQIPADSSNGGHGVSKS